MIVRAIAARVIRELMRDRRTLAFFLLVPVAIMTLVYVAVTGEDEARLAVVSRGAARFFDHDMKDALEETDEISLASVDVPDDEGDSARLFELFEKALATNQVDGVLYLSEQMIEDRFEGRRGQVHLFIDGSRPNKTGLIMTGVRDAMDELGDALPTIIDASCSALCANSVNSKSLELEEHYLYGSSELDAADYFLPVLPPFFVFFLTFIISTVTFQRERTSGTLERLLVAPISFRQVVMGYALGFAGFASVQSAIVLGYFAALIQLPIGPANLLGVIVIILMLMLLALLMGLLASFFAKNEFQAIQFIPLVILPQIFLSDIIWDIHTFPRAFQLLSYALPLTHANIAVREMFVRGGDLTNVGQQLAVLGGFLVICMVLIESVGRRQRAA